MSNWVRLSESSQLNGAGDKPVTPEQMELARLRAELARMMMERDIAKTTILALPRPNGKKHWDAYTAQAVPWPSAFWRHLSPSKNLALGDLEDPTVVAPRATPIRKVI